MTKIDTNKRYSISDVSKLTGYEKHVLRYYEDDFELDIPRNKANHRYYTYKEVEIFQYIKSLQDKGFTNKQIKLILNSPEVLLNEQKSETAVTVMSDKNGTTMISEDMTKQLINIINKELKTNFIESQEKNNKAFDEIKQEIENVREEIRSKERDILICKNAKLKMKVKEKSYTIASLKKELKKEKNTNKGIIKKLLSKLKFTQNKQI